MNKKEDKQKIKEISKALPPNGGKAVAFASGTNRRLNSC